MNLVDVQSKLGVVYAIVDDEDAQRCARYWRMHKGYPHTKVYAGKVDGRSKWRDVPMHRFILGEGNLVGLEVDHVNRNRLDCRRANLRPATRKQNTQNVGPQARNVSGLRGVHWDKANGRWKAAVRVDGRLHALGYFDTAEAAHAVAASFRAAHMPFSTA